MAATAAAATVIVTAPAAQASPGDVDPTFVSTSAKGLDGQVAVIAVQPDGKVLVGGSFSSFGGVPRAHLARLNANGTLDRGFAPTGSGLNGDVDSIAVQPDGRILVGGGFTSYNGVARSGLARVNTNGTLDVSFAPTGSGLSGGVNSIALQPDGKVLVGGGFTSYNGVARNRVARLKASGALDTSFAATGSGLNGMVSAVAVQADGRIVIGGAFTSYNGVARNRVARLNANGTLDTSFAPTGTGPNGGVLAVVVQPDGKILVGGQFWSHGSVPRNDLARLNTDGTLDVSFAPTGSGLSGGVNSIALQPDGKVLVGGMFTSYNDVARKRVARLNANGTLDTSFAPTGTGLDYGVSTVAVQPDGRILVGGWFTAYDRLTRDSLARLNANGTLDTTFRSTGTGLDGDVGSVVVQPDGKILVGGDFTSYNGVARKGLARLNANGTLDTTFAAAGTGLDGSVNSLALQPDGKILVAGGFTSYNRVTRNGLLRLNANGTLDSTFAPSGVGRFETVFSLVLQSDGQIMVGGSFSSFNGVARTGVARLNDNGTLDTTFATTGSGFDGGVRSVAVQSDGKTLVGGTFSAYDGVTRNGVARLNVDGTLDTSFAPTGSGLDDGVHAIVVQPNGKILVGGTFTSYNGVSRPRVARLNANGSLDTSFGPAGMGPDDGVRTMAVQSDGRVVIGGWFSAFNGVPRPRLARLNTNGTLDTTFTPTGAGLDGYWVRSVAIQPDGKVLVAGGFTTYNGVPYAHVIRFLGGPPAPPSAPGKPVLSHPALGSLGASWSAPVWSGTTPISGYQAQASATDLPSRSCTTAPPIRTCTFTGLVVGASYTVKVRASNTVGWGPWSAASTPLMAVAGLSDVKD